MTAEHLTQTVGGVLALLGLILMVVNRGGAGPSVTYRGWTFSTPSAGFGILLIGVAMITAAPVVGWYARPPKPELFHVSGRILLHEGKTVHGLQNVVIGIIPMGSHAAITANDGSFKHSFPRGDAGQQYQVFAYQSNPNPALARSTLGVVTFDLEGRGMFDYTFEKR